MVRGNFARLVTVLFVSVMLVVAFVPGPVAAQQVATTVIVEDGETVGSIDAVGGSVIIHGTVDGDVSGVAGSLVITGTVTGTVDVVAGGIDVTGTIGGDATLVGGEVVIGPAAVIGGSLTAAGGTVAFDGTVGEDATIAAETLTFGPNAAITGDLEYDGGTVTGLSGAAIGGAVVRNPELSIGPQTPTLFFPETAFAVYGFLVNLAVGAVLLVVLPTFSRRVGERVRDDTARTAGIGILAGVGIPVAIVLLAITIIGIPFAIIAAIAAALLGWVAAVYGRFAVGAWVLTYTDFDNRWGALLLGFVLVALAIRIPYVGWVVELAVALLGLGAVVSLLYDRWQSSRETRRVSKAGARGA